MKLLKKDFRKGFVKVLVENLDDMWYLSHIIEPNDRVKGQTTRKIKLGSADDRNTKIVIKKITLSLTVEKVEFHKYTHALRVSGKIDDDYDDIAKGSYHTINVEPNTTLNIEKTTFLQHQIKQLNEAATQKSAKILICTLDRETATFALIKRYGYELIGSIEGNVQKKDVPEKVNSTFYKDIVKQLKTYHDTKKLDKIVIGSPAFWKEYIVKELENTPTIKNKVITATCSAVGEQGIKEILRRKEILTALQDDRIMQEMQIVEELLAEIAKQNLAAYGKEETQRAAEMGAVKDLLITDSYIQETREDGTYNVIDRILKSVDTAKGTITIVSSDHEGGKKLDGLGGIAGILRYKI
jgi:protein pelota